MKDIINNKNKLANVFLILYTLSIILDLHFFYNRIATLIRIIIITIFGIIVYFKYHNTKEKKYFLIYFFLSIIYIILHLLNASNFASNIDTKFNVLKELLYFYKMIMNIWIFYIVFKLNIDNEKAVKYIKYILWFISLTIVISNLFKIGYSSYAFDKINCNIMDWFHSNKCGYLYASSKGFFHLANQIVAIILLYLPILINDIKNHFKIDSIVLSFLVALSSLIIGNRLASAGPLIILILALLLYLFLVIIKKEKFNYKYVLYLVIFIAIYNIFLYNSPILKREKYYDKLTNGSVATVKKENIKDKTIIDKLNRRNINENFFLTYYPYENDPEFWNNLLNNHNDLSNSRYIEKMIIKRVKDSNSNSFDGLLGIGYERVINIFNIEQDFVMQYYSIGIIGSILFLGLYFVLWFYSAFKILNNLEGKFNYLNIMLLLGTGFFLVAAYYSGNILNAISTIIPISFILGILVNEVNKKNNISNKILGFKVCELEEKDILNNLDKDLKNNKQNIIYNINPLIITNFYKNEKIREDFNKQKYQIPDGYGIILASKMKDNNIKKTIPGIHLFESICELASNKGYKVFLYGSKEKVIIDAKKALEKKYIKIKIVGTINGYVKESDAIKAIKKVNPDILFVALGSPKQENFIINNKNLLKQIKIIMPIGGSLDVISGNTKRAPAFYIKYHLEWFYRMIKEPKRIKQNIKIINFVFLVIFRNNWYNKDN